MIESLNQQIQAALLGLSNFFTDSATEFKNPGYLWLLLLVFGYLAWYEFWYVPRRLIVPLSYDPHKLVKPRVDLTWLRVVPRILQAIAGVFIVLALARPIAAFEAQEVFKEGIDIMLVLDTSGSMETEDFRPNRLEVAKKTAVDFIKGRVDDRIGIVLFAEDAFAYAPLTLDYNYLYELIENISSNMMPKEGTALGSAVAVGINRMNESTAPSKIMILLTDGASNRGQIDPITAGKLAQENDIKIYSIGIGKEEFQQRGIFGVQTIKSDLDEETMQKISEMTGGQFFRSEDEKSLPEIFDIISQMETTEVSDVRFREEQDVYPPLIIWAIILLGAAFLVMASPLYNPLEG